MPKSLRLPRCGYLISASLGVPLRALACHRSFCRKMTESSSCPESVFAVQPGRIVLFAAALVT